MPYGLQEADGGWYVIKKTTGKRMSKKPLTRARAAAQLRALEINVTSHEKGAKLHKVDGAEKTDETKKKPKKKLGYPREVFRGVYGKKETAEKGGPGSGHFGHAGRPGHVGGSADSDEGKHDYAPKKSRVASAFPKPNQERETAAQEWNDEERQKIGVPGAENWALKLPEAEKLRKLRKKIESLNYQSGYWQSVVEQGEIEGKQNKIADRVFKRMGGWNAIPKDAKRAARDADLNKAAFMDIIRGVITGAYKKDALRTMSGNNRELKPMVDWLMTFAWEREKEKSDYKEGITVYKEKNGKYRWIAVSSSAFRDDDNEIVSMKALQEDIDNSDTTGEYGVLRWWHVPNLDIGSCDFRMLSGQMLVESGEFFDNKVGERFKESKDPMQMSIGFYHPIVEPDKEGVYHTIKVFERSVMPAGMAANRFTQFITTKGVDEMASLKEKLIGLHKILKDDDTFLAVVSAIEESRKEGEDAGVDFKELKEEVLKEIEKEEPEDEVEPEEALEDEELIDEEESIDEEELDEDELDEELDEEEPENKEHETIGELTFDEFGSVVADVLSDVLTPVNDAMKSLTTAKEKAVSDVSELRKMIESQSKVISGLEKTVKELSGETTRAQQSGFIASESDETVVSEEVGEKIKESLKPPVAPIDEIVGFITGKN